MTQKFNNEGLLGYVLLFLAAPILFGWGTTAVSVQCQPANAVVAQALVNDKLKTASSTAVPVVGMNCDYYTNWFFGLWPKTRGSVSNVQAMFTPKDSTKRGAATKAIELTLGGGMQSVQVLGFTPSKIDARDVEAFNEKLAAGVAFNQKTLLFTHGTVMTSVIAAAFTWLLPLLLLLANCFLPPLTLIEQAGSRRAALWLHWQRTGGDGSNMNLGIFVVPVWMGLAVIYMAACLAVLYFKDWLPSNAQVYMPVSGPGLLGLIDLINRLRTIQYVSPTPLGLTVTRPASIIDRLTFEECGWFVRFPTLPVPSLPVWLIGGCITVALLTL